MFLPHYVPPHLHAATAKGKKPQARPAVVLVAAASAIVAALVGNATKHGLITFGGSRTVVLGVLVGLGAAALGLVVARAIGKQGRV